MRSTASQSKSRALVVVAKEPVEGFVKTRLSRCLSPADAATFYECLLTDIVAKFKGHHASEFWLAFAPGGKGYFSQNYPAVRLLAQRGEGLGDRLYHIFVDLFSSGYREVIIADTDSPGVPLSWIDEAFERLGGDGCDLVLGPSDDGGYYLIGVKCLVEGIFRDIAWSTDSVLAATLTRADELGLKAGLLPSTYDIDVAEDLARLWNDFEKLEQLQALAPRTYDYVKRLADEGSLVAHTSAFDPMRGVRNVGKR